MCIMGGISVKKVKEWLKKVRPLKTWQLLLILVPILFITATMFRFDHIKMATLKDAVLAADLEENDEKINIALIALKKFTFSHIVINVVDDNGNQKLIFGTGPFYLEKQYIRAATVALEKAKANLANDTNPHGNIYSLAANTCRIPAIKNGWAWNNPKYINCMLTEINKYPATNNLESQIVASLPSTELYRHNYASPIWAFSLSGCLIILIFLIVVVIFIRFIVWLILRLYLMFL